MKASEAGEMLSEEEALARRMAAGTAAVWRRTTDMNRPLENIAYHAAKEAILHFRRARPAGEDALEGLESLVTENYSVFIHKPGPFTVSRGDIVGHGDTLAEAIAAAIKSTGTRPTGRPRAQTTTGPDSGKDQP